MTRAKKAQQTSIVAMSPRGRLSFGRRVCFSSETVASGLAGVPIPLECAIVEQWRAAVGKNSHSSSASPIMEAYGKVAHLVHVLRAEMHKERVLEQGQLYRLLVVPVAGEERVELITGRPGVLTVIVGRAFAESCGEFSIDTSCAVGDLAGSFENGRPPQYFSDGISFGAAGVRLTDRHGRTEGLVVWVNSQAASRLYRWMEQPYVVGRIRPELGRYARRALRREARRTLRRARHGLIEARDAQRE